MSVEHNEVLNDDEFIAAVRHYWLSGYEKAPKFIEREGITTAQMLKTLLNTKSATPEEISIDAGAIAWCLDQLEGK